MIGPQTCKVGQTITFSGYADDYGENAAAVEFSLDDGKTWAHHDLTGADPHQATMWTYSYTPQVAGRYQLRVRSVSPDGRTSPVEATVDFIAE